LSSAPTMSSRAFARSTTTTIHTSAATPQRQVVKPSSACNYTSSRTRMAHQPANRGHHVQHLGLARANHDTNPRRS
jgi:hypothetical protein